MGFFEKYDTEQLRRIQIHLRDKIGNLEGDLEDVDALIRERTSPWPWPKTGSRLLEIWRQRARPNSGE